MTRLLLDSHALIWSLNDDVKLSSVAREAINTASEIYVSAASAWEIATKYRLGKLPSASVIMPDLYASLRGLGVKELAVSIRHGQKAGMLPGIHRDPFDRMLIAQALIENLVLVSNEIFFDQHAVNRIW